VYGLVIRRELLFSLYSDFVRGLMMVMTVPKAMLLGVMDDVRLTACRG
jgi:hypothetical protein